MAVIDLTPETLDLVLYAGDGVRLPFEVTDVDENPVNLTGTIEAQIRDKRNEIDTAEAEFSVDMTDAAIGKFVISLTGTQTQALTTGLLDTVKKFKGFWDIQWTPSGSETRTICQGKVECGKDVTR